MDPAQSAFDPLKYLGIHVDQHYKAALSDELMDQLSKYITIRTIQELPLEELTVFEGDMEQLFAKAQSVVPDFDQKVKEYLKDFKHEYSHQTGPL